MVTLKEVVEENKKRKEDILEKENLYHHRRKIMNYKLAAFGGFLAAILNIYMTYFAGWLFLLIMILTGGIAGFLIGFFDRGIFLAYIIFALLQGLGLFLNLLTMPITPFVEEWNSMVTMFTLAGWGMSGGLIGLGNNLFDDDHRQI